ncbi:MAG: DUF530 domain-containing protein [Thermococci archaeon]|nr:DUF530 domain-containing protein [Thermococci archaeon]
MTTTEELVARVNKILDDIGIDVQGIFRDMDDVRGIVYQLRRNMTLLQELEEELQRRVGDRVPYSGRSSKDRDPHIQWIYRKKRNRMLAMERLKSAITAHKIAIGIISGAYTFKAGRFEVSPFSISSEELKRVKAIRKPYSLGRLEVIPHLAYSGDVLRILSRESVAAREAFKSIKSKLREKGRTRIQSIRIEVDYVDGKRVRRTRVELPMNADIDGELRKRFGRRIRWRVVSFVKTKGVLINNHYTVDNLALAYAVLNPEEGERMLAMDLFRYYFLTSGQERETMVLYPGTKTCVDCHYSIFDRALPNGSELVLRKCAIEKELSGRRSDIASIPNYLLGGIILYGLTDMDEDEVAGVLGVNPGELRGAMKQFVLSGLHSVLFERPERFEKFMPRSDRAREFLELLQG